MIRTQEDVKIAIMLGAFVKNIIPRKNSNEDKQRLAKDISKVEIISVIQPLNNDKSPGADGLPMNFKKRISIGPN